MTAKNHITVFEHDALRVGRHGFTEHHRQMLEDYYGEGVPYFSLIHNGVKFNEHVGVLQAGTLTIEVLPKADKDSPGNKPAWQRFLITMLQSAGILPEDTGYANLRLRSHSILELYMQLFLGQTRYLLQTGLARQYRKEEGNTLALKGSLQFAQNIRHNLTHAERFYVRHTVYDRDHIHNAILRQALSLISRMTLSPAIKADAASLIIDFPEFREYTMTEALFRQLIYSRKTEAYRTAHSIARLLLLNYHPDIRRGTADVLALMFDMNVLWEKYILKTLRRELQKKAPGKFLLHEQVRTDFWKPHTGYMRIVKPDIIVYGTDDPQQAILVIDTKWKRLQNDRPADDDLKQMLVYNLFKGCKSSALVYPAGRTRQSIHGSYQDTTGTTCALLFVPLLSTTGSVITDLSAITAMVQECVAL